MSARALHRFDVVLRTSLSLGFHVWRPVLVDISGCDNVIHALGILAGVSWLGNAFYIGSMQRLWTQRTWKWMARCMKRLSLRHSPSSPRTNRRFGVARPFMERLLKRSICTQRNGIGRGVYVDARRLLISCFADGGGILRPVLDCDPIERATRCSSFSLVKSSLFRRV